MKRQFHPRVTDPERQLAARAAFELLRSKREYGEVELRPLPTSSSNATRASEQRDWPALGLLAAVGAGPDDRC
jgi:hypothetical protein